MLSIGWEKQEDPMTQPATRSRENTRARLVAAASVVFAEVGVEGASVEAICDHAGFTRGAFYSNFASKEELLLELIRHVSEQKIAAVGARVRELQSDGLTQLGAAEIVSRVLEVRGDDPAARGSVLLMNELQTQAMRDPALAHAYLELDAAMTERVAQIVSDVTAESGLRMRLPVLEAARLLSLNWESTAAYAAMAGLSEAEAQRLVTERTAMLAAALSDGPA